MMNITPVIAIFDVGKTNKKLLLFDELYKVVLEESIQLPETSDEDGFPCEDINLLTQWVRHSLLKISNHPEFIIKAINFSAYGASLALLDSAGMVFLPLYNYLKPFPLPLQNKFYDEYGGKSSMSLETASPVLGNLNSGLQLYRLKKERPEKFKKLKYALHLPQYLSFILTNQLTADITSVGCHTMLWNFQKRQFHDWVIAEHVLEKLPTIFPANSIVGLWDGIVPVGIGLHDSSAALIPYLASFDEQFVLLSTGTWCISLNPFNDTPLNEGELRQDCLCFLTFEGKQVKASRLFTGYEHEQQIKRLAQHFGKPTEHYATISYDSSFELDTVAKTFRDDQNNLEQSGFVLRDLNSFGGYNHAYHQLVSDIVQLQVRSLQQVLHSAKKIFVDGGFGKNEVFMNLLATGLPSLKIMGASVSQSTAMGAAIAIHPRWNSRPFPRDVIELKSFSINP